MNKNYVRRRSNYRSRNRKRVEPTTNKFALKVFIAFMIFLSTLYLKKYEIEIGNFSVDSIYEVLYYNEDFNELSNKVFKIGNDTALGDFLNLSSDSSE